jgi:hypothetical protein
VLGQISVWARQAAPVALFGAEGAKVFNGTLMHLFHVVDRVEPSVWVAKRRPTPKHVKSTVAHSNVHMGMRSRHFEHKLHIGYPGGASRRGEQYSISASRGVGRTRREIFEKDTLVATRRVKVVRGTHAVEGQRRSKGHRRDRIQKLCRPPRVSAQRRHPLSSLDACHLLQPHALRPIAHDAIHERVNGTPLHPLDHVRTARGANGPRPSVT